MRKRRCIKVFIWILVVLALAAACIFAFIMLYPGFGGVPDSASQADYAARAENFKDGKFVYPEKYLLEGVTEDIPRSSKGRTPESELPVMQPEIPEAPGIDEVYITWLGHSTVLIQMHGKNLLIDPIFSEYSSPVQLAGPKRFSHSPISIDELPRLDAVLLTHDHYDHLDMDSIKALDAKTDRFIVPLGVDAHLTRWNVDAAKITAMAWWEELDMDALTIACAPARHYTGRFRSAPNRTLFASWVFMDEYHRIFDSGDSAYGSHFADIGEKYGEFDLALMDGSQYNMKWHSSHMFPEESISACGMLGTKLAMPVHWGAFSLAPHAWDDPPERFTAAAEEAGLAVITPMIGQTFEISETDICREKWWQDIK